MKGANMKFLLGSCIVLASCLSWNGPAFAAEPDCDAWLRIDRINSLGSGEAFQRVHAGPPQSDAHRFCSYSRKNSGMLAANILADPKDQVWPATRATYEKFQHETVAGLGRDALFYVEPGRTRKSGRVVPATLGIAANANHRTYHLVLRMEDGSDQEKRSYLVETMKHLIETVK